MSERIKTILKLFVGPGFLVSLVQLFVSLTYQKMEDKTSTKKRIKTEEKKLILTEPPESKIKVKQEFPTEDIIKSTKGTVIDPDISFVAGESEMPLSVYESPLMSSYREFKKYKKNSKSDELQILKIMKMMIQ
eukprot:gene3733-6621_t